jgi:hypothetical protein
MAFSPPVPDEELLQAVDMVKACGSKMEAARQLGFTRGKLDSRLHAAALRGFMLDHQPAMPGFRISQVTDTPNGKFVQQKPEHGQAFEVPDGHVVKGVSALVNAEGEEIVKWIKTKEGQLDPLAIVESLKDAFKDYKGGAKPAKAPSAPSADILTVLPCNDWHIGMFAWGKEVGGENWDLKIAEDTIGRSVEDTVARSPSSGECVVLGGGDLLHADNSENKTSKSGNVLQVDGRYQKVVGVAAKLMVRTTDAALRRHDHVTLRILPGNHDEHSAVAVAYFLLAWYRNEPRVTVDVDPSLFWWHRFGKVMLGATHGHTVKIAQMPAIMAARRPEDWGATKFRYVHGFHLHHAAKIATEGNGVICEVHQAPIPQDAWHFGAGFLSGRSLQAITYHRDFGEVGRVRTAILDGATGQEAQA